MPGADLDEQPLTEQSREYRMACETCGHNGYTNNRLMAYDLVDLHNEQKHDGEPVATVEHTRTTEAHQ